MTYRGIPQCCEFRKIRGTEKSLIEEDCPDDDNLQAAHIKPHATGGSDEPENGLWLCAYHHRVTEGHLKGRRDASGVNVRFVANRLA